MNKNYSLAQLNAIYCVYKDLNLNHIATCVTCGKSIYIDSFEDCFNLFGHFIPRSVEPKLKYHPKNTHCQCPLCNLNETEEVKTKYKQYMQYRYGKDIEQELLNYNPKTEQQYIEYYTEELLKLSAKFPELLDILVDKTTGEVLENIKVDNGIDTINNNILKQFYIFSVTYRQDLDTLCKILHTKPIEYERL